MGFHWRYDIADIEAVAQPPVHNGWLELVADWDVQTINRLAQAVHVATVGAEGDEGARGGVALAVQQVGRVDAHFSGGWVWGEGHER